MEQVTSKAINKLPKVSSSLTKKAKKKLKEINEAEAYQSIKPQNALDYLKKWGERESGDWKFKKSQHVFLLQNWKKSKWMSAEDFESFVQYMKGDSSIKAKQTLIEDAQKLIDAEGEQDQALIERARSLVQSL